jgi:hypothetical protein
MSEVHDQAIHLLAQPQAGTFLTPEAREMVLRALEEVADEDEIERLRVAVEQARDTFTDLVICLNVLRHPIAAEACQIAARAMQDALKKSPAAPNEDVKVPSDTPLPNGAAGDVVPNSQQEPEPRDQVAGVEGSTDEGPAGAPEQDREAGALRLAGGADPGEGATASPAAAKKWGHNARGSAWHLWSDATEGSFADGEWTFRAPCGEEVKGAIVYADRPVADNACLDCAASIGWEFPEKLSLPSEKKKRNTPDLCVVDSCTEKGSSRNQWCCGSHAAKLNLTERRAALDAWKKARMNGAAPALAGGTP